MAGTGRGRTPLVADKRYGAAKKPAPAPQKPAPKKRRAPRPRRQHGLIVGLILGLFGLIWRVFWGVTWRIGVSAALALAGVVFYFQSQLPPVEALVATDTAIGWIGSSP